MVAIDAAALTPYFQCSEWRGINWQVLGWLFPEREWMIVTVTEASASMLTHPTLA